MDNQLEHRDASVAELERVFERWGTSGLTGAGGLPNLAELLNRVVAMAKVTIAHKPDLTKEQAQEIFSQHFSANYRVVSYRRPLRDFVIEKNPFVGVAVKLVQQSNQTSFVYNAMAPRWWAAALLGALISAVLGRGLTAEVRAFIDAAPEFH